MSYCDEFGLKVLMGVITEEAPYWLEQAHPEARYVDAKGNAQRLGDSSNNVSGGWPGLCLDWEPVRQAAGRFIHEMAKVVSQHPSLYAYDCWNEPHIEPAWARNIWATPQERLYCYCDRTIAEFQRWLEGRYGSLEQLNEAWVRQYPNWKAIDPPRFMSTYLDWLDWRRFIIECSTDEMRFRAGHVREVDSKHVVEGHAGRKHPLDPVTEDGVNDWRLAEVVDVWGFSHFPRWESLPVFYGAAVMDLKTGGTLILETGFGMFDERCFYNPVIPPYGLAQSFGYREKESYYVNNGTLANPLSVPKNLPPSDRVYYEPGIQFAQPVETKVKAHTFLTPIELRAASAIGSYDGKTVAATSKFGKGEVYFFGTNLGASIAGGDNRGIELLQAILTRFVSPPVRCDRLRPRLIEGTGRSLLAVFNDTVDDQAGTIKLPPQYRRATDIHTQRLVQIDQNAIRLTLPYQSASVLLLE